MTILNRSAILQILLSTGLLLCCASSRAGDAGPPSTDGSPSPAEASVERDRSAATPDVDLQDIVAFLTSRATQDVLSPDNLNEHLAQFGLELKDFGKGETGWDFRGEARTGLIRRLDVQFLAPQPNTPGRFRFRTATFSLQGDDPGKLFDRVNALLTARLKKPSVKRPKFLLWTAKGGRWEVSSSLRERKGPDQSETIKLDVGLVEHD